MTSTAAIPIMERTGTMLRSFLIWASGPASVNFLTLLVLDASHYQISNYAPVHFKGLDSIILSMRATFFLQHNGHLTLLTSTQETDRYPLTAAIAADNALQVARLCYRFICGSNHHIQSFQFGPIGRSVPANLQQFHARLLPQVKAALERWVKLYAHASHPQRYACCWFLASLHDASNGRFQCIQGDGETKPLSHRHHGRRDTDYTTHAVYKRPA